MNGATLQGTKKKGAPVRAPLIAILSASARHRPARVGDTREAHATTMPRAFARKETGPMSQPFPGRTPLPACAGPENESGPPGPAFDRHFTCRSPLNSRRSDVVRRLAVVGRIQSFAFLFLGNAQSDDQVRYLVGDERRHAGPDDGGQHALELDPELLEDGG